MSSSPKRWRGKLSTADPAMQRQYSTQDDPLPSRCRRLRLPVQWRESQGYDANPNRMAKDALTAEEQRLDDARAGKAAWRRWGPYVSERQWGTVREDYSVNGTAWEYFSHEHARSRAYRWGEDGIAGICDDRQTLCFALALWNGADRILKERLFGLTGNEGNHGEDVKEYYFYLDNVPSHAYMKCLYKYPQRAFPYADLVAENKRRGRRDPEYELIETGIFADDRYFDVFVEYAKVFTGRHPDPCQRRQPRPRGGDVAPAADLVVQERLVVGSWPGAARDCDREVRPGGARAPDFAPRARTVLAPLRCAGRRAVHRERIEPRAPVWRAQRFAVREGRLPCVRRRCKARCHEPRAHRIEGGAAVRSHARPRGNCSDSPSSRRCRQSRSASRRGIRRDLRAPAEGGRRILPAGDAVRAAR